VSELDRDMKESEEYEDIDMFHTDKNIVKEHINLNFKKNNGEGNVPCSLYFLRCEEILAA
jgi:hypothetical protein